MAILVTQASSEAVILPDAPALRVTQVAPEALLLPDAPFLRMTQVVGEPLILPTNQRLRVTQCVGEVVVTNQVNTCEESWTFPTVAAFPIPALSNIRYSYFDEVEPDWGNYGQLMGDGNPIYGTLQTAHIRYFIFEYTGLTAAEADTLDAHFESTRGALRFTLTHPRTAEVITGVRYESYTRSPHRKSWIQERAARLVKFTN